jgi:cbb3-type cytochrome oxidase subunit 3
MGAPEKERESILGIGQPANADPSAWRPSKAARGRKETPRGAIDGGATEKLEGNSSQQASLGNHSRKRDAGSWRPSEAVKERLSSLAPVRGRRRFAMPRVRLVASLLFFAIGFYIFLKLWTMPTETDLHPALAILAAALVLLLIAAIVSMVSRRRRAREDEKSTLRL